MIASLEIEAGSLLRRERDADHRHAGRGHTGRCRRVGGQEPAGCDIIAARWPTTSSNSRGRQRRKRRVRADAHPGEVAGFDHRATRDAVTSGKHLLSVRRRRPGPASEQGAEADRDDCASDQRGSSTELRRRHKRRCRRGRLLVERPVVSRGCIAHTRRPLPLGPLPHEHLCLSDIDLDRTLQPVQPDRSRLPGARPADDPVRDRRDGVLVARLSRAGLRVDVAAVGRRLACRSSPGTASPPCGTRPCCRHPSPR